MNDPYFRVGLIAATPNPRTMAFFTIICIYTATGQAINNGKGIYGTRDEAQLRADFYNEQVADEPYHYAVVAV